PWIADALFQTFGIAAWSTTILALFLPWRLAGRPAPPLRVGLPWGVFVWSFTCIVGLTAPAASTAYPLAGLVGLLSLEGLTTLIGPAGSWIVAVGAFLAALPFALGFE